MRPDEGAVDEVERPVEVAPLIGLLLERGQDPIPDARRAPAVEPTGDRAPRAEAFRQIPPWRAGLEDPEDPIDDPPMVMVRPPHRRPLWWEKLLQALPLRFA